MKNQDREEIKWTPIVEQPRSFVLAEERGEQNQHRNLGFFRLFSESQKSLNQRQQHQLGCQQEVTVPPSEPAPDDITRLSMRLRGPLYLPKSAAYNAQLTLMQIPKATKPALIISCHDIADIQQVLTFVKEFDLELSVRSGGQAPCGSSCRHGSVVVDLSRMHQVEYDPNTQLVTFETGATVHDVSVLLERHDRMTPLGNNTVAGTGGLVLHGGVGWLLHKFGASCDNVTEMTIVLANGTVHFLDDASRGLDADLYFGARGAAGVLGIVTSVTMRTYDLQNVTGGLWVMVDDDQYTCTRGLMKFALSVVQEEEARHSRKLFGGIYMGTLPAQENENLPESLRHHPASIVWLAAWGTTAKEMELLNTFVDREVAFGEGPKEMSYVEFNQLRTGMFMETTRTPMCCYGRAGLMGLESLTDDLLDEFAAEWSTHDRRVLGESWVGLEIHGGREGREFARQINRSNDNCVSMLREYTFLMPIVMRYPDTDPSFAAIAKKMCLSLDAIIDYAKVCGYSNYTTELINTSERRRETVRCFSHAERLRSLKAKVDPDNLFDRPVIAARRSRKNRRNTL